MTFARTAIRIAAIASALLCARVAHASCAAQAACPPCNNCRVPAATGANPTVPTLASMFDQVAAGPSVYGTLGWDFVGGVTMLDSGIGHCGMPGPATTVPAHFPCLLLKAIYVTESNWRQFCASGLTVIAFDCGYGIAQVTSGMNVGQTSAFDPVRVAAEPAYNVSVGAEILGGKWQASACVGNNDPDIIEDWYVAVWGYNGFAFSNNPNNPMYAANRPEYRTPGVASAQVRGNYPYQEVVWGYAHYPPSAAYYTGMQLAYPDRSASCSTCGRPGNIPEPVGSHVSNCPIDHSMTDAGMPDAGMPDAGMSDAMSVTDASAHPDARSYADATDGTASDSSGDVAAGDAFDAGGSTAQHSGCGCTTHGAAGLDLRVIALLALATAALRRRRS
jgi:hypothetical protein